MLNTIIFLLQQRERVVAANLQLLGRRLCGGFKAFVKIESGQLFRLVAGSNVAAVFVRVANLRRKKSPI